MIGGLFGPVGVDSAEAAEVALRPDGLVLRLARDAANRRH